VNGATFRPRRRGRGFTRAATVVGAAALVLALAVAVALAAKEVPFLAARVNDPAGIVPAPVRERLETQLQDLERRTGAQVAVLTVASLEGDTIEDFAVRVFQTWKLGRRGVDDGALFVVARQERRMRIEVGYGLEDRLTDARSRQILDEVVRPHFRDGNFGAGIQAGVDAIAATIEGTPLPAPPRARPREYGGSNVGLLFFGLIFLVVIGTFSLVALVAPGGVGWFLYLFLVPFYAAFPTALYPPYGGVIAAGVWLLFFPIARALLHTKKGKELRKRHGWVPIPGDGGGRWRSGGGFSGGGGGGGGFSGGGGSSGGGGASSSW
jgi:uncharacterized protein